MLKNRGAHRVVGRRVGRQLVVTRFSGFGAPQPAFVVTRFSGFGAPQPAEAGYYERDERGMPRFSLAHPVHHGQNDTALRPLNAPRTAETAMRHVLCCTLLAIGLSGASAQPGPDSGIIPAG